jgi:hypothetical protein
MLDEVPLPQMKHTERERERERGARSCGGLKQGFGRSDKFLRFLATKMENEKEKA